MKINFLVFAIGGSLPLASLTLSGQVTNTNALPLNQTLRYQVALEHDRSLGEHALLPPGLKEKLQLTNTQRAELQPIEDGFAQTSQEYQTANQPRIDAAEEASRDARETKNSARIEAARKQLQQVWAGLQRDRDAAVKQIKPLLTPEQLLILNDEKNQWRENHGAQANDPSAN